MSFRGERGKRAAQGSRGAEHRRSSANCPKRSLPMQLRQTIRRGRGRRTAIFAWLRSGPWYAVEHGTFARCSLSDVQPCTPLTQRQICRRVRRRGVRRTLAMCPVKLPRSSASGGKASEAVAGSILRPASPLASFKYGKSHALTPSPSLHPSNTWLSSLVSHDRPPQRQQGPR